MVIIIMCHTQRYVLSYNYVDGGLMHDMIRKAITVITDPPKSGQPLYSDWFYKPPRNEHLSTSNNRQPYFSWSGHLHHYHHYTCISTRILYLLQSTGNCLLQMLFFVNFFVWVPISHQLLFYMNRTSIVINVSYNPLLWDHHLLLLSYTNIGLLDVITIYHPTS